MPDPDDLTNPRLDNPRLTSPRLLKRGDFVRIKNPLGFYSEGMVAAVEMVVRLDIGVPISIPIDEEVLVLDPPVIDPIVVSELLDTVIDPVVIPEPLAAGDESEE